MDRDIAYREIQELVTLGTRAWLEGRLPVLRKFLQTHEALKNADYRQLFSVPRAVATRELSRPTTQHYLALEGERRGARYRAGPGLGPSGQK